MRVGVIVFDEVVRTQNVDFEVRAGELIAYHGINTNVVIPEGIKVIGEGCFEDMHALESVFIPEGVEKICRSAFFRCEKLERVVLPSTITTIEWAAFSGCFRLTDISLPSSVIQIGDYCFHQTAIHFMNIPQGVTKIGDSTFRDCAHLTDIKIPNSVTHIGTACFCGCQSLKSISISGNITVITERCFYGCTALKSAHFPISVTRIGESAFEGTPSLDEVYFPFYFESPSEIKRIAADSREYSDEDGTFYFHDGQIQSPWFKAKYDEIENSKKSGCYIATAVYGSYNCPEVWILRRYRDYTLAKTWYGRAFINTYYTVSPALVKRFGCTKWFKNMWKPYLDKIVTKLRERGVADTPYHDER